MASQRVDANSLDDSPIVALMGKPCYVSAVHGINTTGAAAYLQLFDKATIAEVSLGTTVPTFVLSMATGASATQEFTGPNFLKFENGICAASTTTSTGSSAAITHARVWIV